MFQVGRKYGRNNGFVNSGDGDTLGIAIAVIPSAVIQTALPPA